MKNELKRTRQRWGPILRLGRGVYVDVKMVSKGLLGCSVSGSLARVTYPIFHAVVGFRAALAISILVPNGMVSYLDAATNKTPNLFLTVRYRVTPTTGSDGVDKLGVPPPTVALLRIFPGRRM